MTTRKLLVAAIVAAFSSQTAIADAAKTIEDDGTVHVPAFDVPFSEFASLEMRRAFVQGARHGAELETRIEREKLDRRQVMDEEVYKPAAAKQRARYAVDIEPTRIAGLYAEILTPRAGVPARNQHRIHLTLHGGGFRGVRISA